MTNILFICHGNICRSPMAEFMTKDMARRAGIADEFYIESAATSSEELGNPVYPPARRKLAENGIDCSGKRARRITKDDLARFDLILGMDEENTRYLRRMASVEQQDKLHNLLEYAGRGGDAIADPWYTGDFDATWDDLYEGCMGLLNALHPEVTLDFSACTEREDFYTEMGAKMLWQKSCGHNLDALHDVLTGLPHLGTRFLVKPPEAANSPAARYADRIVEVMQDAGCEVEI